MPPIGLYVSEDVSDDDDPIYEYTSEELHTPVSSEDKEEKHEFLVFNKEYGFGEGRFKIGTKFATIDGFKEVVKDMFISEGRKLLWIKNDKERVRVDCRGEECPWLAHLSYNKILLCYQVNTYKAEHTCARDLGSNAADQHWVSKKVEKRMASQPHMTTNEAIDFLREEFNLVLHPKMVYRVVKEAKERIMGNKKEQYGKLRDYAMEIIKSNPGSTARVDVIPIPQSLPVFDKIYISFEGYLGDAHQFGWNFMSDQQKDQSQTQTESLAENSAVQEKSPNHVISQNAAATTPSAPIQPPFRPPSQLPRMGRPKTPAAASKFRPKQTIRRPRASANPPSNSPPTPLPDTTQTQSTSASVATSEETLKVAGSEAIGMNFIPTPGSKNQKN
ncbi:hypothetical protein Ahy_B08g093343 [Arachis hypogaea]|uniref:Transposase MuDR plant domain-containing protein n=1 Tax=Arachis hypogaea TaxID=3818 RepID=A0A444Y5V6_ARAHY|nr:hypothetical protein Ahy_B08g093343 [Arachis hypogaea]